MEVTVLREACCAQDDQIGPLEATYSVSPNAKFSELVAKITESSFLQYSSSHTVLQGEVEGNALVRVFSPFHTNARAAEFFANPNQPVASTIGARPFLFRFVFE